MATTSQREKAVERHLLRRCRENGFLCLKFTSPAHGGVPDRVVITPSAGTVFIEVKSPGGDLEHRQRIMHDKMRRFGGEVYVVDDEAAVDELVARLRHGSDSSGRTDRHRRAS